MKVFRHDEPDFAKQLRAFQRRATPHPQVEATVREIVSAVREKGDAALLEFTARFGGPRLAAKDLRVTTKAKVDAKTKAVIAATES